MLTLSTAVVAFLAPATIYPWGGRSEVFFLSLSSEFGAGRFCSK